MKKLMQMFWVKMFWAAARRLPWRNRTCVGARTISEFFTRKTQVTLVVWDLTRPNYAMAYSREELVRMMAVIRQCEREMGWKVPEPGQPPELAGGEEREVAGLLREAEDHLVQQYGMMPNGGIPLVLIRAADLLEVRRG